MQNQSQREQQRQIRDILNVIGQLSTNVNNMAQNQRQSQGAGRFTFGDRNNGNNRQNIVVTK